MQPTLSDFHYSLPAELIAQEPTHPRDHCRLMKIDRTTNTISHHFFYELPDLIPPGFHLVANNTKVFPARLLGTKTKTGGKVELLLLSPLGHSRYRVIAKPGLKTGEHLTFSNSLHAEVIDQGDLERVVSFDQEESALRVTLSTLGTMPTPPYIKKMLGNSADYQTIYAKYGFSAAAPTAGLHFTPRLLARVKSLFPWHELTLDVGLGTFLPVKVEDVTTHHMHSEPFRISPTLSRILSSRPPTLAVGTTTLRALESSIQPGSHETRIFIYPPYQFQHVDALLTNFHLPGSTLLMLVAAFCTAPQTTAPFTSFADSILGRAYAEAIAHKYRFFSFGDAMLIV